MEDKAYKFYINGKFIFFPKEYDIVNYYFWDFNEMKVLICKLFEEKVLQKNPSLSELIKETYIMCIDLLNTACDNLIDELCKFEIYEYDSNSFISRFFERLTEYEEILKPILEEYYKILELSNELSRYRQMMQNQRLHINGGGFGVKGAVKGMITAYILNSGLDFIRGFSDAKIEKSDNAEISRRKSILKKAMIEGEYSQKAIECVTDSIREAFFEILYEEDVLSKVYNYNKATADIIINNILNSDNSIEYKKEKITECLIKVYPYQPLIYKKLLSWEQDIEKQRELIRLAQFFRSDDYCSLSEIAHNANESEHVGLKRKRM